MEYMFSNCSSLISLNLNSFNTSYVAHMKGMFKDCSSLILINLYNFNISNANISNMFDGINENLTYCIKDEQIIYLSSLLLSSFKKDCNIYFF